MSCGLLSVPSAASTHNSFTPSCLLLLLHFELWNKITSYNCVRCASKSTSDESPRSSPPLSGLGKPGELCDWRADAGEVLLQPPQACEVPRSKKEMVKNEKGGIWWINYAKAIYLMLFCRSLDCLTSSVSKGTGTPRQGRVHALKSPSVPRIAKWKYSNRLLTLCICSVHFNSTFLLITFFNNL